MEQALKDSEQRYREFIARSIDAVWRFECEEPIPLDLPENELLTRFLREAVMAECNDAMARLYGLSGPEELIGKRLGDLPVGFDAGRLESYSSGVRARFQPRSITFQTTNAVGKPLCLLRMEVPTVQDGKLVRIWGITRDITDLKLAEEASRESEQRYRTLFENSPVGIYRTTPDGRILAGNPTFARMMGYSSFEELASRNLNARDFEPECSRRRFKEQLEKEGQITGLESQWRRRDGSVISVRENARAIRDDSGRLLYYEGTAEDVTEHKQAEKERQRSLEQLRALAASLQNIREEERKRVAREIHDQLGQALTAIKLDLSSLTRDFTAEQSQQWKRASSVLRLVDQTIQSVRRISTELRPGMLDDLGLVATVEWATREFAARTGTKCHLDLPKEHVALDPETATALFRILQETLTNVGRHASASEVKVRLAQQDGELTLEVHDNGRGITEDEISSAGSLGILGMRERALLLGGEVTLSGAPEKGTTVSVRIPFTCHKEGG
jgi:PAS domain S-box-containing protein